MTDIQKLEKMIKEQAKQLDSMRKAMSILQSRMIMISKKTDRTYQTGRKNVNDINNLAGILKQNK